MDVPYNRARASDSLCTIFAEVRWPPQEPKLNNDSGEQMQIAANSGEQRIVANRSKQRQTVANTSEQRPITTNSGPIAVVFQHFPCVAIVTPTICNTELALTLSELTRTCCS